MSLPILWLDQVNYQQLPINQPKCPYHNNMHDGAMQMTARDEEVSRRCCCVVCWEVHLSCLSSCLSYITGSSCLSYITALSMLNSVCKLQGNVLHGNILACRPQVNYWPSNVEHTKEAESDRYTLTTQHVSGMAVKEDLPPVEGGIGDFFQAGERIRGMDEGRCDPGALT